MKSHRLITTLWMLLLCLWSCSEESPEQLSTPSIQTRSVNTPEDAVYHEATASWIRHRNDPYTLENFRQACDNLAAGRSAQSLSQTQADELASLRLEATHYNVRIYPRTEKEQWELEQMQDVTIAYVPFDYEQLSESEAAGLDKSIVFPETGRYTVVHEGYQTNEGPSDPETIHMPVLYGVWPCTKPFPAEMDYEILHEVFLPEHSPAIRNGGLAADVMHALENEAIRLATGHNDSARIGGQYQLTQGSVTYSDSYISRPVPIYNLLIRVQLGSRIWDRHTDQNGFFSILETVSLAQATISFIFLHEKWKITPQESINPITINWGKIGTLSNLSFHPQSDLPNYEIHRAVNYFYNGSHTVPKSYYPSGIRIIASGEEPKDKNGLFHYPRKEESYITIFNNNRHYHPSLLATVFHELGHFVQFALQEYDNFYNTHDLLKESYANYIAWYLGERYYTTLGYVKHRPWDDITNRARQEWEITCDDYYSSLFVDLADDYNQFCIEFPDCPEDEIAYVPASLIHRLARECCDWTAFKNVLREYVGVYYSKDKLEWYLADYEYWVNHHNPYINR